MVDKIHYRWDFVGLSTDSKPTPAESPKVVDGSTYYESDTSKLYVFYKDTWYEKTGSGGGASYTAGDGIDITSDVISVDTETIQPKLTAGTNITIDEDNVISAEGGATIVQSTGDSTTDVMSQKAVTDELFHNGNRNMIQIGSSASSTGGTYYQSVAIGRLAEATYQDSTAIGASQAKALANYALSVGSDAYTNAQYGIAIGCYSNVRYQGSVGLGAYSKPTSIGSVDIGSTSTSYGYNSSNYRLLTGLYDGQSAHDAVTVEQVNATIDAINTALSTSIPHIGA